MGKSQPLVSLCLSVDKVLLPETWGLAEPLAWDDAEMLTGKRGRDRQDSWALSQLPVAPQILWLGVTSGNHLFETQFLCLKTRALPSV